MRLYIPGAGRTGRDAWPKQSADNAVFAQFVPHTSKEEQLQHLAQIAPDGPVDVVAHSLGAERAVLALGRGLFQARRLILLEPALYDLARGDEHIEKHISTVTRAHQRSSAGELYGFWEIFRPLFFGGPADPEQWDQEKALAEHFASVSPPWGDGVTGEMIPAEGTIVATGNWNPEYEAIADALSALGARHIHVTGSRHRPQDHQYFEQAVFGG